MRRIIYNVGNMVSIPDETLTAHHLINDNIIFIGKMSYEPNILAVTFFANKIYPYLKSHHPGLSFKIIGANPDIRVKKLSGIDGVEVTGFVDTVEPYFQNASIVVAPMLTGAGIQNKIIQAMSYGCCVATTSIGAEGLTIANNELAIYNTEEEWISGMERLLSHIDIRKEMGYRARQYVITHLSKRVIASQFWKFIDSIHSPEHNLRNDLLP